MPPLSNLEVISLVDSFPYHHDESVYAESQAHLYTFKSHDKRGNLGYVLASSIEKLRVYPDKLVIDDANQTISISEEYDTVEKRSTMMNDLASEWRNEKKFDVLSGLWMVRFYVLSYFN